MKRGFYTIMSAQFFSSLADNALFVAAVELLRTSGAPEWQRAALVPMFALFYVVLAPFVGAFADALPKGRVMFVSNAIKIVGCLMMLFGSHPLIAYAVAGLGAAAYSPAKYGILTELLPASQLVKANGWIEGLTIASIILGVLLGGQLVGQHLSTALLSIDIPMINTGVDTAAESAIAALIVVYALAAWFNTRIPHTGVEMRPLRQHPQHGILASTLREGSARRGRISTPVCGMRVLNHAASAYTAISAAMAASAGVSTPVSISGRSKPSSMPDSCCPTSWPPNSTPRMIDAIVRPSIQPLALTSCDAGSSSVRMPYLAGE